MFVSGQFMHPDGVYIGKWDRNSYWTLLISAKMFTSKLLGVEIKKSTDWSLLYHQKDGKIKCTKLKGKLNAINLPIAVHFEFILLAQASNRGGCHVESNDVIMYVDETLLKRYFPTEHVILLKEILARN